MQKRTFLRVVTLTFTLVFAAGVKMQAPSPEASLMSVPTTKVLAIGSLTSPLTEEQRKGSGYRSSIACSILQRAGFPDIRNTLGGMTAWYARALPVTA